jgi:hypothetical protein
MGRHKKPNPEIAAAFVNEVKESEPKERQPRDMAEYIGLAAEVAQDTVYVRNTHWDGAEKFFETEPLMKTVDKWFPYAVGGPLYVDSPTSKSEERDCIRKAEAMKKLGYRYCYIGENMDLDEVQSQLKEEAPRVGVA